MKQLITVLMVMILFFCNYLSAQDNSLFSLGMTSLNSKDTSSAEGYFKKSIWQNRDAASFFELANIQIKKNTYESRNLAFDNLKQAILRDPENIDYRMAFVKLKMEISTRFGMKELLELNLDNIKEVKTIVAIGDMYEGLFEKYLHLHLDGDPLHEADDNSMHGPNDFRDYAEISRKNAEESYLKALSMDINNENAVLGYARLNAFNGAYKRAIYYLDLLYEKKPDNKDLNLYLGMYNYKIKDYQASLKHFNKAFTLMNEEESDVFTYHTVIAFLNPDTQKELLLLPLAEQKKRISKFWETKDPFFLSEENERLVEHYYRVAYSNYFLSAKKNNIPGWKTDRGKVLISFGDPVFTFMIYFPNAATTRDYWYYNDRVILFESPMNDNFKLDWRSDFVGPRIPPVSRIETSADIYDRQKYDRFNESELKSTDRYLNPLAINVFRSFANKSENDIYFTYMLPMPFTDSKEKHEYGLFFINNKGEFLLKKTGVITEKFIRKIINEGRPNYQNINTISAGVKPGNIRYSFETRTLVREGVSSLQREFTIAKFNKDSLDLSGVVVATKVADGIDILGAIKRNDIYIIPKIGSQFEPKEPVYIYYEVYNLKKQSNGLTDFEQTIVVKEPEPVETGVPLLKVFKTIAEFVTGSKNKISLTSSYKTKEANSQIYQQLDFSGYKPGRYDIYIIVTDKTTGQKSQRQCSLEISDPQMKE